jgi:hypothetical protein
VYLRLLALACLLCPLTVPAQKGSATRTPELPVRKVVLYKNGVGYFEHAGRVNNSQQVEIDFTTSQLNDVLQSLTALDLGGGRISGVSYNSTSPIDQQLKAIPLALGEDPTLSDLFGALRGAHIEVTGGGAPVPIIGRLLNIEIRSEHKGDVTIEHRMLTVVSDAGSIRSIELTAAVNVRLLDADVHQQLGRYLNLMASTRDQSLRHLTLQAQGTGERELKVSYISEVPVWKSTYRIVFPESGKKSGSDSAILQGWAVVDNTVGSDWENVHLSLVAGAPQSFLQPLSQPYYARRPELGLPAEAMTTPQTHEGAAGDESPAPPPAAPSPEASGAIGGSIMNRNFAKGVGRGTGGGTSAHGSYGMVQSVAANDARAETAEAETSEVQDETASASSTAFDDYFEYALSQPISIRKNESALVPILQANVEAERVTLWSPNHPQPWRALWLTNTSDLTLDRGSFSIFEKGEFAGEGLLDPIHSKEKRLLSYAVDQGVHVTTRGGQNSRHIRHLTVKDGVLTERSDETSEVTYEVHNSAAEPRTVVIEHPIREGWKLTSDAKPVETSASSYRFRILLEPGQTVPLRVGESRVLSQRYALADLSNNQLFVSIKGDAASEALTKHLAPVSQAKAHLNDIDRQIGERQQKTTTLVEDQKRLHDNLLGLKDSAEERALAKRYAGELNADEDQLLALRTQLNDLGQQHIAAQQALNEAIRNLDLDADLPG